MVFIRIYEVEKVGRNWRIVGYHEGNNLVEAVSYCVINSDKLRASYKKQKNDSKTGFPRGIGISQIKKNIKANEVAIVYDGHFCAPSVVLQVIISPDPNKKLINDLAKSLVGTSAKLTGQFMPVHWVNELTSEQLESFKE